MAALIKNNFPKSDHNNKEQSDLFWKIISDPVVLGCCLLVAYGTIHTLLRSIDMIVELHTAWYTLIGTGGVVILTGSFAYLYAKLETSACSIVNIYED